MFMKLPLALTGSITIRGRVVSMPPIRLIIPKKPVLTWLSPPMQTTCVIPELPVQC